MKKLTSRKFWITVAMLLGSIATAIEGLNAGNETIVIVGVVCGIVAGCIYNLCEALVDSNDVTIEEGILIEDNDEGRQDEHYYRQCTSR